MERNNVLFIIAPCHNESEIIKESVSELLLLLKQLILNNRINKNSRLVLIDDGSTDDTWKIIQDLHKNNTSITGIKLSRNFGQFAALAAGYTYAYKNADLCISLDIDLQDDISIIPQMISDYYNGSEVVLGLRKSRDQDTFLKRYTAKLYYRTVHFLGSKIIAEHSDYRLLSKKALGILEQYFDVEPYIKGIVPLIGLKTTRIFFKRKMRMGGKTNYNYRKMIGLAIRSIVKTSDKLLLIPFVFSILSLLGFIIKIPFNIYASAIFLTLGIFGLYICEIKKQVFKYPIYIIELIIDEADHTIESTKNQIH